VLGRWFEEASIDDWSASSTEVSFRYEGCAQEFIEDSVNGWRVIYCVFPVDHIRICIVAEYD